MTLQEAINTGLPFKRPDARNYLIVDAEGVISNEDYSSVFFRIESLIATDWDTKTVPTIKIGEVEISKTNVIIGNFKRSK